MFLPDPQLPGQNTDTITLHRLCLFSLFSLFSSPLASLQRSLVPSCSSTYQPPTLRQERRRCSHPIAANNCTVLLYKHTDLFRIYRWYIRNTSTWPIILPLARAATLQYVIMVTILWFVYSIHTYSTESMYTQHSPSQGSSIVNMYYLI